MAKLVLDEPKTKPKLVLDEPTDFGPATIPKERLPGVWDYDKQLDSLLGDPDVDIEKTIPLDARFDFGRIVGMTEKPDETKDKMASSLFYSVQFGIPPSVSFSILDELNKIAFDGKIPASTAWGRIKQRYRTGKSEVQLMDMGFDILKGTWQDWEKYDRSVKNIEKLQSGMTIDQRKEFRGFFEKLVGASAELAPFGLEAAKEMPMGAAIGGTLFGIAAALATAAIPTIGEEIPAITAATLTGIKVGAGVRGAMRVGQLEAGGQFLELARMKDQYGNRIDPRIAVVASHAVGAINGGIELAEWTVLLGTFGIGKKLFDKSVRKVTHRLLTQGTLKELIARKALDYSVALGAETLQEIEQETTSIVFGELAKELNNAREGTDFKPITGDDLKARYQEITVESMRAFGLMVLPGTTVSGALELVAQKKEAAAKPAGKPGVVEVKAVTPATEAEQAPQQAVAGRTTPEAKITPTKAEGIEVAKVLDKTISRHHGNIRSFLKDVKGDFTTPNRITYREMVDVISKDKGLAVDIKETPIDPSKPLGKTTKNYIVKMDGKELRPIPKEVYDAVVAKPEVVEVASFEKQIRALSDEDLGKSLNKMIKIRSEIADVPIEQWRIEDTDRKIAFMEKEWERRGKVAKAEPAKVVKPTEKPLQRLIKVEKEIIPKQTQEKFTPPVVQKETKAKIPESDSETQNAANLMEGYWREYDERELEINVAATKNQEAITKALDKKQYIPESDIETSKMSQAMMLYIDLKEHPSGHQFAEKLSKLQKEIYELSKNLPAQIKKIADSIIQQNREAGALALDKEVIANARENYIAHLWQRPTREETFRARFRQKTARAKARTLEGGIMEGWAKGKALRVKDVTLATQIAQSQINQAIVGKELLKLGKKWGLLSHKQLEDWVRVEHPGFTTWRHAGTVEVEKGVIKEGQWVRPADRKNLGKVTMVKGDRAMVRFRNKETGLEETKEFPIDQLKVVRSYGKNFFITEEGDLMEKLPVYAEPELGKKLNNVFSPSALYKVPGIETVSRYNAQIKSTILFTSLYHHQAFLRSYAFGSRGLNPKTAYEKGRQSIMNMTPEVRLLVRNGLTIGRIQDYDPRMIEGEQTIWGRALSHTKLTEVARKKLVALRKSQERFLFNKMGPALKIQAGLLELKAELKRNQAELESGEITADEIAAAVANLMNNDFGGLHLGRMGRSQTAQHIFRLLALAPDWTESNIRSAVQAFAKGETGYLHRMFWGRIAAKGLGATILFNLLLSAFDDDDFAERYRKAWETGRLRWLDIDITPVYRAMGGTDDKRKYFSLLGHFRDPVKFVVHPFISAKHKGSVVSRIMLDMMIGQDWAGREFTTLGELLGITEDGKNSGRLVKYSRSGAKPIEPAQVPSYALYQVRSAMPIPMQNLIAFLGGEMDAFDAITKSLGLMTATTYPEKKLVRKKIKRSE